GDRISFPVVHSSYDTKLCFASSHFCEVGAALATPLPVSMSDKATAAAKNILFMSLSLILPVCSGAYPSLYPL
ncbi:MAG: hypothetical protein ACREX8_07235, partial [Gammaproteobacteria bacterium]